jgi:hypothetical protein
LNARPAADYRALIAPERDPVLAAVTRRVLAANREGGTRYRAEILGLGGPLQNAPIVQGLEVTLGYNPLQLGWYAAGAGGDQNSHTLFRKLPRLLPSYGSELAQLLGLRLIAIGAPLERVDRRMVAGTARLVEEVGRARLYELPALPRAFLAPSIVAVEPERLIRTGRWPTSDASVTAAVEHEPAGWRALARGVDAGVEAPSVRITRYATDEVRLLAESPHRALLVLNDPWYPGWTVTVDDRPAELVRTNAIFRGVAVPAGRHEVVFRFAPLAPANLWRIARGLVAGP